MGEKVETCISIRTTRCHFYFYIPDAPLLIDHTLNFLYLWTAQSALGNISSMCKAGAQRRRVVPFAASS
jgi:hypothetical protein